MTLWGLNSTTLFTSQQKGDRHEGALKRSRIPSRISSHQSSSKAPVSDTDHPSLHLQEDYSYFSFDNASFPCLSSARPGLSSARLVSLPRPAALSLCQHPYWRPSLIRSIGVRVNICPSRAPTFCASLRRDRLYFVSVDGEFDRCAVRVCRICCPGGKQGYKRGRCVNQLMLLRFLSLKEIR